jgi:hypothetical protein
MKNPMNWVLAAIIIVGLIAMARAQPVNPCGEPEPQWRITTPSFGDRPGSLRRCITVSGVESCLD